MFSGNERESLKSELISAAEEDTRVSGAALLGSGARGQEDAWSDIDLALCVGKDTDCAAVIADWSGEMYEEHGAVHHLDVPWRDALYRVFLLQNTLQVDLSFWPPHEFRATSPNFRPLFGTALEDAHVDPPAPRELIGMGWLYALHGRSSIARGRLWQAEYMVSLIRDQVLALACLRHGLAAREGRGMDDLPDDVTDVLAETLIGALDAQSLRRALAITTDALLSETELADPELAMRLADPLRVLGSGPGTS